MEDVARNAQLHAGRIILEDLVTPRQKRRRNFRWLTKMIKVHNSMSSLQCLDKGCIYWVFIKGIKSRFETGRNILAWNQELLTRHLLCTLSGWHWCPYSVKQEGWGNSWVTCLSPEESSVDTFLRPYIYSVPQTSRLQFKQILFHICQEFTSHISNRWFYIHIRRMHTNYATTVDGIRLYLSTRAYTIPDLCKFLQKQLTKFWLYMPLWYVLLCIGISVTEV